LEISRHLSPAQARQKLPQIRQFPLIRGGDVHRLDEFLGANLFTLAAPTVGELAKAFLNEEGRSLVVRSIA
jgi:hypothetical protein